LPPAPRDGYIRSLLPAWPGSSATTDDNLDSEKRSVPAGVFTKCPGCRETILTADLKKQLDVCPKCDHHFLMGTRDRVALVMDEGFEELDARIESIDPLGFKDSKKYPDRLRAARRPGGDVRRAAGGDGQDR
jgi:acetyl-CoA carboxylase carboxyl transferase subunit beta